MESVWPRLPVHADAGLVAARITEMAVERQAARLLIEIHDEQAVVTVFAGVQNDSATVFVSGDPVRLLLLVQGYPRHLAHVGRIGDVVGCQRVHRG
jgi:hypothetical protein